MHKILKAILSGKSKKEIIGMMSGDEKAILTGIAKNIGFTRQQRRKILRDAKKVSWTYCLSRRKTGIISISVACY